MSFLNFTLAAQLSSFLGFAGAVIVVIAFVVLLCLKGKTSSSFAAYCKKVSSYLNDTGKISKENEADFVEACFDEAAPEAIRLAWQSYAEKPFGYPSGYFKAEDCIPSLKKDRFRALGLPIYVLIIAAAFAVSFILDGSANKLFSMITIPLGAILWFVLYIIKNKQDNKVGVSDKDAFEFLLEDLDTFVFTQNLYEYVRDVSDLQFVTKAIDEIAEYEATKPLATKERVYINDNGEQSSTPFSKRGNKIEEAIQLALEEKKQVKPAIAVSSKAEETFKPAPAVKAAEPRFSPKYDSFGDNMDPVVYPPLKVSVPEDEVESFAAAPAMQPVFGNFGQQPISSSEQFKPLSTQHEAFDFSGMRDEQVKTADSNDNYENDFSIIPPDEGGKNLVAEPVDEKIDDPFLDDGWDDIEIERNTSGKTGLWKTGRKKK